jgi:dUTP pyrophosphatase
LVLRPQAPAVLISAGIALRIGDPEWCALVLPRSGLGHRAGLVLGNTVGVIDADYEGPLLISAWNRNPPGGEEPIPISPGDRIAQLIFTRIARAEFTIVTEFGVAGGRQEGGFGSTGIASACPNRTARRQSSS